MLPCHSPVASDNHSVQKITGSHLGDSFVDKHVSGTLLVLLSLHWLGLSYEMPATCQLCSCCPCVMVPASKQTLNMMQPCRTCKAVELFAAACLRLGIPPNNNPVDPYTGDPMPDSSNPYAAVVPLVLRQHLTALLPGIHALTNARLDNPSIPEEYQQLKDWLPCFVTVPVPQAVLKVWMHQ